jgi:hypothetical protein
MSAGVRFVQTFGQNFYWVRRFQFLAASFLVPPGPPVAEQAGQTTFQGFDQPLSRPSLKVALPPQWGHGFNLSYRVFNPFLHRSHWAIFLFPTRK